MRRVVQALLWLLIVAGVAFIGFMVMASPASAAVKVLGTKLTGVAPNCTNVGVTAWGSIESATMDFVVPGADTTLGLTSMAIGAPAGVPIPLGSNVLYSTGNANPSAALDVVGENIIRWDESAVAFRFRYDPGAWNTTLAGATLWRWDNAQDRIDIRATLTPGVVRLEKKRDGGTAISSGDATVAIGADGWAHIWGWWKDTAGNNNDKIWLCINGPTNCVGTNTAQAQPYAAAPTVMYLGDNNPGSGASDPNWLGRIYFEQIIVSSDSTKNLYECRDVGSYP